MEVNEECIIKDVVLSPPAFDAAVNEVHVHAATPQEGRDAVGAVVRAREQDEHAARLHGAVAVHGLVEGGGDALACGAGDAGRRPGGLRRTGVGVGDGGMVRQVVVLLAAWSHGVEALHEVGVGGDDDATGGRHVDLVGAGRPGAASEIHPNPCTWVDGGLGVLVARLHGEGAAAERHDPHHAWLVARE